jgi:hypothetical protein
MKDIGAIPDAGTMLADKGYDADWFRSALKQRGIVPCIPSRSNRRMPLGYDPTLLPAAPQDREHVRTPQGLAPHPHPLRPMRPHLHVCHLHRCNRHLLALIKKS